MKKYRFARTYLFLMTVCAVITLIIGALVLSAGLYESFGSLKRIADLKTEKIKVDTKSVDDELRVTYSKVSKVVFYGDKINAVELPSTDGFPVSEKAALTVSQRSAFVAYLKKADAVVKQMKSEYVGTCNELIDALDNAAKGALRNITPKQSEKYESSYQGSQDMEEQGIELDCLYDSLAFERSDLARLKKAAEFMSDNLAEYTPDKQAHDIGKDAGAHITKILGLIEEERSAESFGQTLKEVRRESIESEQPTRSDKGTKGKESLVAEYISNLNYCRKAVSQVALNHWKVDGILSELQRLITLHENQVDEYVVKEKGRALKTVLGALISFGVALVSALLLLVFRDFLSATIDIAMNTDEACNLLKRLS
jgi:hypothetical protein